MRQILKPERITKSNGSNSIVKTILFSAFAVFLALQAYKLVMPLFKMQPENLGFVHTLVVAFLLNLYVTGVFAFPGFVFPTSKLIGNSYYQPKQPKLLARIYTILGVGIFRKALLFFFWGRGKNRTKYFNGTRSGLANFAYQSRQSEFGHLGAFVIICGISAFLLLHGHYRLVALIALINVFGNFYPIVLQRYHRIRIERILK